MDTRCMESAGNDLHSVFVCPIAPDISNVATHGHQHGVPREQRPIIERCSMAAINIGHKFGGPSLRRAGAALVGGKAQVTRER